MRLDHLSFGFRSYFLYRGSLGRKIRVLIKAKSALIRKIDITYLNFLTTAVYYELRAWSVLENTPVVLTQNGHSVFRFFTPVVLIHHLSHASYNLKPNQNVAIQINCDFDAESRKICNEHQVTGREPAIAVFKQCKIFGYYTQKRSRSDLSVISLLDFFNEYHDNALKQLPPKYDIKPEDCCEVILVVPNEDQSCSGDDGCGHYFRQEELFLDHVHYLEKMEQKGRFPNI